MSEALFKWSDFPQLTSADELDNYIKYAKCGEEDGQRAYRHDGFFHYTKLEIINDILGGKSFLLFSPGESNDPIERGISRKERRFMLSFSTGIHENIPLWYLYGGVDGRGGRLSFTATQVRDMVQNAQYSLIEVDEQKKPIDGAAAIPLSASDFDRTLQDVIYYEQRGNAVTLKYNTMTNNERIPRQEFEEFLKRNDAFVKSLPWYYEKETRLLIELTDGMMQRLDSSKQYAVKLYFGNLARVCKGMKLLLAPEAGAEDTIVHSSEYPAITQFALDSSNIRCSKLSGQIEMHLCRNCSRIEEANSKSQKL